MIERSRDIWLNKDDCPARELVDYITNRGRMRDAQIDAIKTYLYLKIAHGCRPLYVLYSEGAFNSLDLESLEISTHLRKAMERNPGLASLYEYLDDKELDAHRLVAEIKKDPNTIDVTKVFRDIFYGVSYTDYIFSLPMGAGKTYLMAAFIYLDLYFSRIDPANNAFARNFVVFAPSGLKSSVVPSLMTIKSFDPSWVIPEPAASELRSSLAFEVLDEQKSANRSNRAKNPNVQKVAIHQPFDTLTGLVLVTNAEKVILDNVQTDSAGDLKLIGNDELDDAGRIENELREIIGKLPGLAIIIDEVHHAQNDDIKLRAVVSRWATTTGNVNCVLGFSGTPYLQQKVKIELSSSTGFKSGLMANVVNYYPLAAGIGNFLKRPTVKIVDGTSDEIIRAGIERFLDDYGETTYANGTTPKMAIFCGTVAKLEDEVMPLVAQVLTERRLDSDQLVLKYHRGGTGARKYPVSAEWGIQFAMLDSPLSEKRIILLAQIGKEGWDCRSLAGVVLSQEGDCSKNMVLQTSCRCLREVVRGNSETALIFLNDKNAAHLERQLEETQRIDLKTFLSGQADAGIVRHSRMKKLRLPMIDHVRFEFSREMTISEPEATDIELGIRNTADQCRTAVPIESVENLDFSGKATSYEHATLRHGAKPASYRKWKHDLLSETGPVPDRLAAYASNAEGDATLRALFDALTEVIDGETFYAPGFDQIKARSIVRSLFYPRREVRIDIKEVEGIALASFVNEKNLKPAHGAPRDEFYPDELREADVLAADESKLPDNLQAAYDALIATGQDEVAANMLTGQGISPVVDNTYQYIPYHFDSLFEQNFFQMIMALDTVDELGLEVYYNGDNTVADFRIDCYKKAGNTWKKIGKYTPDFLVIRRNGEAIDKVLIVETKGLGYSRERGFVERREFMERVFVPQNNARFRHKRFDYRVLTDNHGDAELRRITEDLLHECFA